MLFNSYEFIFLFLPLAIVAFFLAGRLAGQTAAALVLILASVFFYGWWNPAYLGLLGAVMLFTYVLGQRLSARPSKVVLAFGITVLLSVLGYYKYANFFVTNAAALTGQDWTIGAIVLPLAISFFTFQKIAYLVDSHKGLTKDVGFIQYALFVVFFPQLIAGPIVHYKEVVPQFRLPEAYRVHVENIAIGLTIFCLGLFKKAVLADGIAVHANPVFNSAEAGVEPDFLTAWSGALAYTFQLYFDFSGYSDMAIGAARMFNIKLPLNFNSPYKALSISDFWRRWHMTLSQFLRDYLYIALGGNRHGAVRRYVNLFLTMLLGGIWHGAGWPFLFWGALHGSYLIVNHGWARVRPAAWLDSAFYRQCAWALTFLVVILAWVPFRAPTFEGAQRILAGMVGLNGISLPAAIGGRLGGVGEVLQAQGVIFVLGGGSLFVAAWLWIITLFLIARFLPNTQEVMAAYSPAFNAPPAGKPLWRPTPRWAMATAVVATGGILALSQVS